MLVAAFPSAGTGTVSITKNGSWESLLDSTPMTTAMLAEDFELHTTFMVPNNTWSYLFDLYSMRVLWWNAAVTYYDASGAKIAVPGLTVVPMTDYLLSVKRVKVDPANTNFEWRLENLATNAVQTATTGSGLPIPTGNPGTFRMGHASTHFNHYQGPFFICNSDAADTNRSENMQQWLRNAYNGGESSQATTTESTNTWYQLYDSKRTTYTMEPSGFGDVVNSIELEFENHLGTRFDPKDCVIELHAK
jgi:hypothetical protein